MQKRKFLSLLLAAALCMTLTVPALAADRSLWPDYYSIECDSVKVDADITYHYAFNETVTSTDTDLYYAITSGATFTVTNIRDDAGFVFVYYVPYTMQTQPLELVVSPEGDKQVFQDEYVSYNDGLSHEYYLNQDGGWSLPDGIISVYNEAIYDTSFYVDTFSGLLLYAGDSVTFTLPDDGTDTLYALWVCYANPETGEERWQYSEFKYDSAATPAATVGGFTDVYETDYYADAVVWAKETGVTAGTSDTTFSPNATVTRAEAVTFLWRAAGSPEPASAVSDFSDVTDPNAYYYKAVLWAAEQNITNGVGGGVFGLNETLPYDQILTFLCRAAGQSATGSDWSAAAVEWAASNGLTDGLTFAAQDHCPRADVVYCLWRQLAE